MQAGRILCLLITAAISPFVNLYAQQFGGNPPGLHWRQVNTDTVRVIFPAGLEKKALEVAGLVHQIAGTTQQTIGPTLRKVNIVMQNQTTVANGYVSLGPFRSEFFLTPDQNSFELGSLPWHKTLALHEYRHVQQFNNFRKGLSKAFYLVFGEEGQALANNLAIPDWFWEGDAVYQETLLSNQGRGRIPYFFNPFRSVWTSGKNYSWMKLRNGSYRDMVPDHYPLGYMLVSYGREKFGEDIWRKITDDAVRFRGLTYPFQHAVKKFTGISFKEFRDQATAYFRSASMKEIPDSAAQFGKTHPHFVGDYEYPQWVDRDHLVYVKSSYSKIPAFYTRDLKTGKEKKIRNRDISQDNYFSYRNNRIVYASSAPNPRWGWRKYSVIKMIDTRTGKEKKIRSFTKYFSPDISKDGKMIVAVLMDAGGRTTLHLIGTGSGKLIREMPNDDHLVFTYPKFVSEEKVAAAVRNERGEMALGLFDLKTGGASWLTPFGAEAIGFTQVDGDTITFSMTDGFRDRLFASIRGKLYVFEPTEPNTSTSDYQLNVFDGRNCWTTVTSAGNILRTGTGKWAHFEKQASDDPNQVYDLVGQREEPNILNQHTAANFPTHKYAATLNLFNFHSWRPYISDPEYSYSLVSENILNTFQSELSVTYNRNEHFKKIGASMSYAGIYPVIQGGAEFTIDRNFRGPTQRITWNEFNANAGVKVPLSFNAGFFSQKLTPSVTFNNTQVYYTGESKSVYQNKQFSYGEYSLSAVNQMAAARQNIYPRFAQTIYTRYRSILSQFSAHQLLINGSLYFPGFSENHSIVVQSSMQQRDTMQQYNFSNAFPVSRGYSNLDYPRMWMFGANYHFPIAYPDAGFGNIVYLLRIRANLYYDRTFVKSLRTGKSFTFRSAGTEVYFDTKWWNQLPVSFGIRYSRLLDNDPGGRSPNQWELVLPLNLLNR